MNQLLDTHALLWFLNDDPRLAPSAKALIEDPVKRMLVSMANCWAIAIKVGLKKLDLGEPATTFLPLTYASDLRFLETPIFTEAVEELLDHNGYRTLQLSLNFRPEAGAVIPRSGGLRKLRWALAGKGKRGGCRTIDFWRGASETFFMLYAYGKRQQDDLTSHQLRILSCLALEELG